MNDKEVRSLRKVLRGVIQSHFKDSACKFSDWEDKISFEKNYLK